VHCSFKSGEKLGFRIRDKIIGLGLGSGLLRLRFWLGLLFAVRVNILRLWFVLRVRI